MDKIKKVLIDLGYSIQQSDIYIDLFKHGPSTLKEIADRTRIARPTLYNYYPPMVADGLLGATSSDNGRKKLFAENPNILKEKISKLSNQIQRNESELSSDMDKLKDIYEDIQKKPKVKYYSGEEGMKIVMREILRCKRHFNICMGESEKDQTLDKDPACNLWFCGECEKRNIKSMNIIEDNFANREYEKKVDRKGTKIKFYQKTSKKRNAHIDKYIFGDFVAIFDSTKLTAILIYDHHLAENERVQFEIMWESLG